MKKKILALCLVVVLAVTAVTSATLAYFTDTDADVNVMTTGNMKIVQNEEQREYTVAEDGTITVGTVAEAFEDNKILVPAVISGSLTTDGKFTATNGDEYTIWDKSVNNEVDKFVTVTNTGSRAAYVRTIFAFQDDAKGTLTKKLHTLWGDVNGTTKYEEEFAVANTDGLIASLPDADCVWLKNNDGSWMTITMGEKTYTLCVVTYKDALAAKDTTIPSLKQMFLDPTAGNEWTDAVGTTYEVRAISQAIQAEGFASADVALNTEYKLTQANIQSWFDSYKVKTDNADNTITAGLTK